MKKALIIPKEYPIYPNFWDYIFMGTARFNDRNITYYLVPLYLANAQELTVKDGNKLLFRATTYLGYGVYTARKSEACFVSLFFSELLLTVQSVVNMGKVNNIQDNIKDVPVGNIYRVV